MLTAMVWVGALTVSWIVWLVAPVVYAEDRPEALMRLIRIRGIAYRAGLATLAVLATLRLNGVA